MRYWTNGKFYPVHIIQTVAIKNVPFDTANTTSTLVSNDKKPAFSTDNAYFVDNVVMTAQLNSLR